MRKQKRTICYCNSSFLFLFLPLCLIVVTSFGTAMIQFPIKGFTFRLVRQSLTIGNVYGQF